MSNVFNRAAPQYLISVNTPEFPVADWAINPNVALVAAQPVRYWFLTGAVDPLGFEIIDLVDAATQAAIDAAAATARRSSDIANEKQEFDTRRILRAFAELLVDEFNILRTLHGLPPRTFAQLRTAIRNKLDAGP